jgi:hypothetical protein
VDYLEFVLNNLYNFNLETMAEKIKNCGDDVSSGKI